MSMPSARSGILQPSILEIYSILLHFLYFLMPFRFLSSLRRLYPNFIIVSRNLTNCSMAYKINPANTNPDLAEERKNVQFNSTALTAMLYGGHEKVERRRAIMEFVDSCPVFKDPVPTAYMTREERVENAARKVAAMYNDKTTFPVEDAEEIMYFRSLVLPIDQSPFEMHYIASLPYIMGQADEEQFNKWLPLLYNRAINVAYAQTELGHGSNLRELETTATYDPTTQQFIINSPTLTSIKWWSGNLGKSANYAIVMAQLMTQGQHRGVHAFIVPVRDENTHKPLPGILLGDIGPKFTMHSNDNGFVRFTNVRIPRENMLMKYAKVAPDGAYVPPVHQKLSYGGMVFIRAMMISMMSNAMQKACTIAVRYSCVRRQGHKEGHEKGTVRLQENKLIDYQTQQYRLFPELAKAYAFHFVAVHMRQVYFKISQELQKGDISNLAKLHSLSAGLKAVTTRDVALGIEICRLSCGGHGYSSASGLPELYSQTVAGCTYEGDNIILLLQTARALLKDVSSSTMDTGIKLDMKLPSLIHLYQLVANRMVADVSARMKELEGRGLTAQQAWDNCTVELCRAAKANVRAFILETFANAIDDQSVDPSIHRVLTQLCELYAVCGIRSNSGEFMEFGDVSKSEMKAVRFRCYELLAVLRPSAVQLVDSFDFHDRELESVLGRYDGNVYENLFQWAQQSPLNHTEVLDTFPKYLAPIMRDGRSKL